MSGKGIAWELEKSQVQRVTYFLMVDLVEVSRDLRDFVAVSTTVNCIRLQDLKNYLFAFYGAFF